MMYLNRFEIKKNVKAQLALLKQAERQPAACATSSKPTRQPFCPCRLAKQLAAALRRLVTHRGRQKALTPAR